MSDRIEHYRSTIAASQKSLGTVVQPGPFRTLKQNQL